MTIQDDALRAMAIEFWNAWWGSDRADADHVATIVALLKRHGDAVRAETVAACAAYIRSGLWEIASDELLSAFERGELDEAGKR